MSVAVFFPDDVPEVRFVSFKSIEVAHFNNTAKIDALTEEADIWNHLQPSLSILKEACPEAEAWVRNRHQEGKYGYTWGRTGYYAAFHPILRVLIINESLLRCSDGEKAAILAHEFRHSRQNIAKHVVTVITMILARDLQEHFEIVEYEAERFEEEVRKVVFWR